MVSKLFAEINVLKPQVVIYFRATAMFQCWEKKRKKKKTRSGVKHFYVISKNLLRNYF